MKITYLVNDIQADGTYSLIQTTAEHWHEITEHNKLLPKAKRRYFVVDTIKDVDGYDCMIVEVPYEDYLHWNASRSPTVRNRSHRGKFSHFSIDDGDLDFIPIPYAFEEEIMEEMMICELHDALANWHDWGVDFLQHYLSGKKKTCAPAIAEKYGISVRQARRYKKKFEEFVKKFYL